MNFFIDNAWAQGAQSSDPGIMGFLPLLVLFGVFYLFLIRPQMKRQKEHSKLVNDLSKGDEVVTNGGLLGRITKVDDSFLTVEIAKDIQVNIQRQAVASIMPKGTIKNL